MGPSISLTVSNLPSVQHDNKVVSLPNHLSKIIQSNSCRNSLDVSDLRSYEKTLQWLVSTRGKKSKRKLVVDITEELTWAGPYPPNAACRMEKWPWEVINCFEFLLDSYIPCIQSDMMTWWQCFLDNCVGLDNWHIIAVGKLQASNWNWKQLPVGPFLDWQLGNWQLDNCSSQGKLDNSSMRHLPVGQLLIRQMLTKATGSWRHVTW